MGNESNPGIDKAGYEKVWANHAARLHLSEADKTLWHASRYTMRPFVYFDKILIAWTVLKGVPQIKDILHVTSLDASFQDGIWLRVQSKVHKGPEHMVTHVPRRLPGLEIFAWLPYFNELRYASAQWEDPSLPKNLRLAVCFKMRSKPDFPLVEGEDYLSELHTFREQFPQYAHTRF